MKVAFTQNNKKKLNKKNIFLKTLIKCLIFSNKCRKILKIRVILYNQSKKLIDLINKFRQMMIKWKLLKLMSHKMIIQIKKHFKNKNMIRIFSTNKNKKDMIKQNYKFSIISNKDQIIIFILGKINNKKQLFLVGKKE